MFFKLALRNVKRSFKDYFIYFLTLTFGVCIFYAFNSFSEQKAMLDLSTSKSVMIENLTKILSVVSVFISVVLAFLIIYANNFLIKKRKKELGMYMTLGMSKYKISQIIVVETFIVGIASLVAGLLIGVLLSQGMSVITASMFRANMTHYEFIFSSEAMIKTIFYFGIIFFIVMLFNTISVSRFKLIDLLTAARKNESLKIRKKSTSIILFLLSLILLGSAYTIILKYGLLESMKIVWFCVALGGIGTLLFFMSLSGILLDLIQKNKRVYFKDINMFVLRQVNSKVNTTFVSMTVICLMLFFTIGVLSSGLSLQNTMNREIESLTGYDASFNLEKKVESAKNINIKEAIKETSGININDYGKTFVFTQYKTDTGVEEVLEKGGITENVDSLIYSDGYIKAMKQSDFNELLHMKGEEQVQWKDDEITVISNVDDVAGIVQKFVKNNSSVTIDGKNYKLNKDSYRADALYTTFGGTEFFTVVLPDRDVEAMTVYQEILNMNYEDGNTELDDILTELSLGGNSSSEVDYYIYGITKNIALDFSVGFSAMFLFIGIYVGMIFLLSSAAVLALQQLSEASDSAERYTILRKIGVTNKGINKAIFSQIFIYFMMPLLLAVVHSIVGITVVNELVMSFGKASVFIPSLITAVIMLTVYGLYFVTTYFGYKNIVKLK